MKKLCFVLVVALLMIMASVSSFAVGIVELQVSPGYGGVMVAGETVPVDLEMKAIDRDINGKIKVSYQFEDRNSIVSSEIPVQVSMGSIKKYTMPLMMEQNFYTFNKEDFILVEVFDERGQLLYEGVTGITEIVGEGDLTVGILSDRYVGFTYFNLARLNSQTEGTVAANTLKMTASYFEEARYLEGVDVLVFDGMEENLSITAMDNLYRWINQGGVLILSTGEQVTSQMDLLDHLGIQYDKQLMIGEEGALSGVKQVQLLDESFEKSQQEGIYAKEFGTGKIIFSTYSLSSKQIVENNQSVNRIEEIFQDEIVSHGYGRTLDHDHFRNLRYSLNRVPRESMPSIKSVVTIVAIYILLIGPVGYLVLRKRKLTNVYWRLVSIMAIATTLVVFVAGQGINFNKTVVNGLTIIDQRASQPKTTTFLGVKSSGIGDVDISPDNGSIKWSGIYDYGEIPKERLFYYDTRQHVVFKDIKKFQFVNLMIENHLDLPNAAQEIVLTSEGSKIVVTNPFDVALSDVAVVINDAVEYIGDIPAKDFVSVNLNENYLNQNKNQWRVYDFYDQMPVDIEDAYMKNQAVEAFFDNLDRGRSDTTNYLVMGWIEDETSQSVYVNGQETSVVGRSFWADTIELGVPTEGHVTLPYGALIPKVETTGDTFYDNYDRSFYGYGEATFSFQVPEWLEADESKVLVDDRTGMVYKLRNYETDTWDTLTFDDGNPELILNPEYISREGQIQFIAMNNGGDSFYKPVFSASGVVKND
jgi:hypothetical protein